MKDKSVPKDFHLLLSHTLEHVCNTYGEEKMVEFLRKMTIAVYRPLIDEIKTDGLAPLERHLNRIFTIEEGEFELERGRGKLTLKVKRCPAVCFMRENNYPIFERFCEHTRIVNEAICSETTLSSSVEYDQMRGKCTQVFNMMKADIWWES